MRNMARKSVWIAAAVAVALTAPKMSSAGTLSVNFDLANSSLVLAGMTITNNPAMGMQANGTVAGAASIVLTGVDANGMITAMNAGARVSNFGLNVGIAILGGIIGGSIVVSQNGTATGAFGMNQILLPPGEFMNSLMANITCTDPVICPLAAQMAMVMFPVNINAPLNNTMQFAFSTTGLNMPGNAMIAAAIVAAQGGASVNVNLSGREINRMFVANAPANNNNNNGGAPEPMEAGLLAFGVLALSGLAVLRRRQSA
jgi:hypothetical protein